MTITSKYMTKFEDIVIPEVCGKSTNRLRILLTSGMDWAFLYRGCPKTEKPETLGEK